MKPGYRTQSRDTSHEAEERQLAHWRGMTLPERARAFTELMRAAQQLALAGIRARHPAADEREVQLRLMARSTASRCAAENS